MHFRTISSQSIVLIYVIIASQLSEPTLSPWYLLSILLYLCVSTLIYLVRPERFKQLAAALSIALIVAVAVYIQPLFILLLPAHIYELVSSCTKRNGIALLLMIAPMLLLPPDSLPIYGLVALLAFVFHAMLRKHTNTIEAYKLDIADKRGRIDKLTKHVEESNAYIKQSEYTFKLEERNRMSQDIHDKIGHSMTGALIQMEASKRLSASDPEKSAELLQNAIHISKEGIESIRLVLKNMKPAIEQLGINRLRLMIDEFSSKHMIRATLTHEGNIDVITPLQWKVIMENVQEALTNAVKYSGASAVSVRIQVLGKLVRAEVTDNGKGADKVIKGMGIRGMEERTAGLNGTVIVDGSRGFSVTTLLPHGS